MSRVRRTFTKEDDQFIIDNQSKMVPSAIGKALGRSAGTIDCRIGLLCRDGLLTNIKIWKPPFKDTEEQFLRDNFWTLGAKECARRLNRPYMTVYQAAKRLRLAQNPELQFNHQDISHFTTLTDPFVIYFLGYFWADGTIRGDTPRMTFKIKAPDFANISSHILRLGNFWRYTEYKDKKHPHWTPLSIFSCNHLGLWKLLNSLDYRIKSGTSADKIINFIPIALRHYWWRGYFDGDGSISTLRVGIISFNSGLNQDWTFVHNLGKELDIDFTIERVDRGSRGGSKALISTWNYLKRLIEYMYQGEQFGLQRKKDRCDTYLSSGRAKKPGLTSIYRGVSWDKRLNRFTMQISCNNIHYTKRFTDEQEAARAYDAKALSLYGNKAILNFPQAA